MNKRFDGKRLKELRKNKNITAQGLANSLGVALGTIFQYENGSTLPKKDNVERLSKMFGVNEGYFYGEDLISCEIRNEIIPEGLRNKISILSPEKQSSLFKMVDELIEIIK